MFATEKELTALLGEVEKEFSSFLTKAETSLAKSEDADSKKADKKEDKPEAKEDNKEDQPESKEEAPAFAADAPPSEEAPAADAQAEAPPADAPPGQDGHGYDPEDMAHMDAMYSSMSRPELIAHHDSVKKALDAMGMQEQAAPAQPMAPEVPEMDKCGDMNMQKSETETVIEVKPEIVTTQETELLKSELAAKDSKISELSRTLEAVTQFVTKLVEKKGAPTGKAITQFDQIAKNEPVEETKTLSKQEITAKLSVKASDPKLEKSDREAINAYYGSGQINLTGISHLLK